jgi:hypothetical protein
LIPKGTRERVDNSNKGDSALSHPKSEKVTATDG